MINPNRVARFRRTIYHSEDKIIYEPSTLSVVVDKDDKDGLRRVAKSMRLSLSAVAREAVREYLDNRNIRKEETI